MASIYHYLPPEGASGSVKTKKKSKGVPKKTKWEEQTPDSWTGGCRKKAPNGRNELKFCMQGSFVGYI